MPHDRIAAIYEVVDTALTDLADLGCDPVARASTLIGLALVELRSSNQPVGAQVAVYRQVLTDILAALKELRRRVPEPELVPEPEPASTPRPARRRTRRT